MLPQKLDHRVYVGTGAIFFGLVNLIKIYPYYLLDQLRIENITIALFLMPFAPLGFFIGYKLTQKIDGEKILCINLCMFVGNRNKITHGWNINVRNNYKTIR